MKTLLLRCKYLLLTLLVIVAGPLSGRAQSDCSPEKLIGKWKEVASVPGEINSLDSLKKFALIRRRQISTWEFSDDMEYRHRHALQRSRYKRNGMYLIDTKTCEIILGKKKDARERSNLEIIYVDNDHVIYKSDNNPEGYFTHLLTRSEK